TFADALAGIQQDTGRKLMDGIRSEVESLTELEDGRMKEFYISREAALGQRKAAAFSLVGLSILAMALTLVALIRGLRRRHSLARAMRRKDLLATAFASVGDGILLTDRERRIIFANQAALHLTGWPEEDLLKT